MKFINFMIETVKVSVNPDQVLYLVNKDGKHTTVVFAAEESIVVNGTIDEVAAKLCGLYMAK